MSPAFYWCIALLFGLAGIGAPVALSMIVSSILYLFLKGQDVGLAAEQMIQGIYDSFLLLAIPLFITAANIMNAGTISERLLKFCLALVGRFRGGLGHVNVVANMIFAGMSGSAVADAVGLGKIIIGMMRQENRYSAGYAAAITAAASTIGPIIPPSIPMVMYALISDTSIGYLFLGGFVPGIMMGFALMILNARMARIENVPLEEPVPRSELPRLTLRAFPALMMPVILLFGIYGGATTPTEAAAIAALYALILATFFYRAVSFGTLYSVFLESGRATASVGLVIGASLIFNYIVAAENIPAQVSTLMKGLDVSPLVFLLGVNVLFLILGCLLDATTIILVIIPLFIPTCKALGIDMVHFGVTAVVNCMIGLITPPYGVLLFVINAITGIPLRTIIKAIWPFIGVLVVALLIMLLVPQTVLFLPRLFGYVG
ncbi:TRAP transporter large permease [Prosthecomicrobium hirschii]|uniref:TRAP transporter large permease n=1 Tax=Prosthecodimorpha hirschii TaxID=665126 RepID=UPI0011290BB5|nr:TRAP transporter large permease [Prosthecomicrobium hirschii]MCW1842799.1 TRAP transporter large permease [Prosthecomicrobium hirschii]TPQ52686.1 permease [Prosthecomicrobium hirschii]